MKKRFSLLLVLVLVSSLLFALPVHAMDYTAEHDFCIYETEDGTTRATVETLNKGKGLNFVVQLINYDYDRVSQYTLGFRAEDANGEPIKLYSKAGNLLDEVFYTNLQGFNGAPGGRSMESWEVYISSDSEIKYLYSWVASFVTKDGVTEVSEPMVHAWDLSTPFPVKEIASDMSALNFVKDSDGIGRSAGYATNRGKSYALSLQLKNSGDYLFEYTLGFKATDKDGNAIKLYDAEGVLQDEVFSTIMQALDKGTRTWSWETPVESDTEIGSIECWVSSYRVADATIVLASPVSMELVIE